MPPIRTFKSAPINPHSAGNTSTSTSETPEQPREEDEEQDTDTVTEQRKGGPAWTPATMTASVDESYPAARPGAPAMPAPTPTSTSTSSSVYTPTRTYPSSTTTTDSSSTPPPPQPGARPVPPSSTSTAAAAPTGRSAVPPPPKVGEPVQPASYYAPHPPPPLRQHQQQAIPNSTSTPYLSTYQPPTLYSSTNLAGAGSGPGLPLSQHAGQSNSSSSGGSVFDAALGEGTTGQDILNTAKSWMASAGNKLAEAEEEVWKMVNKKT